jgi:hypothetical protein
MRIVRKARELGPDMDSLAKGPMAKLPSIGLYSEELIGEDADYGKPRRTSRWVVRCQDGRVKYNE